MNHTKNLDFGRPLEVILPKSFTLQIRKPLGRFAVFELTDICNLFFLSPIPPKHWPESWNFLSVKMWLPTSWILLMITTWFSYRRESCMSILASYSFIYSQGASFLFNTDLLQHLCKFDRRSFSSFYWAGFVLLSEMSKKCSLLWKDHSFLGVDTLKSNCNWMWQVLLKGNRHRDKNEEAISSS